MNETQNYQIMTRREILEKNWKDFRLSTGLDYEPMSEKAYEFMENAMEQYAELRLGAIVGRSEQLVCSCGSRLVKTTGDYHCGNAKCSV